MYFFKHLFAFFSALLFATSSSVWVQVFVLEHPGHDDRAPMDTWRLFENLSPFNYTSQVKSQQSRGVYRGKVKGKKRQRSTFKSLIFPFNPLSAAVTD